MGGVLIIGLARSGTTWVGEALSGAAGTSYVDEPDNHFRHPFAFHAKAGLPGRAYPLLGPVERAAPEYATLWEAAFGIDGAGPESVVERARGRFATTLHRGVLPRRWRRGQTLVRHAYAGGRTSWRLGAAARLALPQRPSPDARDVVVKSVYAARSAAWVADRLPVRVLVLRRDLRGVIASWKGAGWLDDPAEDFLDELGPGGGAGLAAAAKVPLPAPGLTQIGRVAWLLACLATVLREAAHERKDDWFVAAYEDLVAEPEVRLPRLAAELGLEWSAGSDARLRGPLAPPPPREGIDPRLSEAEAEEIAAVLEGFSLRGWAW